MGKFKKVAYALLNRNSVFDDPEELARKHTSAHAGIIVSIHKRGALNRAGAWWAIFNVHYARDGQPFRLAGQVSTAGLRAPSTLGMDSGQPVAE